MLAHWIPSRFTISFAWGVIVFFVLSGYLITRILLTTKEKKVGESTARLFRVFYARRSLRIFPIYFLTIVFMYFLGVSDVRNYFGWLLTFTVNIRYSLDNQFPSAIGHLWSLSVEEQFYLLYPLLLFSIGKSRVLAALLMMIGLGVGVRALLYFAGCGVVSQATFTVCAFDSLALGGLLAYLEVYEREKLARIVNDFKYLWWIAFALFALCYFFFAYGLDRLNASATAYTLIFGRFLISLLTFYLIGRTIFGLTGKIKRVLEQPQVMFLGKISYGMYFYHLLIQKFIDQCCAVSLFPAGKSVLASFLVYFGVTVLVSTISWYAIEAPMNSLKRHFRY